MGERTRGWWLFGIFVTASLLLEVGFVLCWLLLAIPIH